MNKGKWQYQKTCPICNKKGHDAKKCPKNLTCWHCGKKGHVQADCRARNATQKEPPSSATTVGNLGTSQATVEVEKGLGLTLLTSTQPTLTSLPNLQRPES